MMPEDYGNDKPHNKSWPGCLHISVAPIRFRRFCYRYSVGPQQGEGMKCDRTRTKAQ